MTHSARIQQHARLHRQDGLSLIELMISMALGLLLLAAITSLIVSQSSHRDELEKSSAQIENGRYATQVLREDIEHAGFYGQAYVFNGIPYFVPASGVAAPDPCITAPTMGAGSLMEAMSIPIQGYNSATASPVSCLPAADFVPGTDVLVIRRAGTDYVASKAGDIIPTTATGNVYLQASAASTVMATGQGATWGVSGSTFPLFLDQLKQVPAPVRQYLVHIYFISPCSNPTGPGSGTSNIPTCQASDDGGNPIPTLMRLELGSLTSAPSTTGWTLTPLVEGIENMQLDYGLDTTPAPPLGDGYPDGYTSAPPDSLSWSEVMAVRINVLARNLQCSTGYRDTKTYNLGLSTVVTPTTASAAACTNGDYKRHVFTELVRAINPSSRLATQ